MWDGEAIAAHRHAGVVDDASRWKSKSGAYDVNLDNAHCWPISMASVLSALKVQSTLRR